MFASENSGLTRISKRPLLNGHSRLVLLLGVLLIVGMWGYLLHQVEYDYDTTLAGTFTNTANLTKAFEEHVRRVVADADKDLSQLKISYEMDGPSVPVFTTLASVMQKDPSRRILAICNEQGIVVKSDNPNALGLNRADSEFFQTHRKQADPKLLISKPVAGILSGQINLPLSRRIDKPDGSFGGIVLTGLKPEYFLQYYKMVDLGADQLISLISMDGVIITRQSGSRLYSGQDVRSSTLWQRVKAGQQSGTHISQSVVDDVSRIISFRVMPDYPLVISVGKSTQVALADFERRKQNIIVGATLASLLIVVFCLLLVNRNEKTYKLAYVAQMEKERLSAVINGIGDEVWLADTGKSIVLANPPAVREFHLEPSPISVESLAAGLLVMREDGSLRPLEEAPPLRALQGEVVRNQQEIIKYPLTGEIRFREVNANPVYDADGNIIGSVSVVRDITQRKQSEEKIMRLNTELVENLCRQELMTATLEEEIQERQTAQEALAENEARYRAVLEQSSEAVLICKPETGEILEANARFAERFGYVLQQDGPLNLFELIIDQKGKCGILPDRWTSAGIVPLQRSLFRHRNGSIVSVELSGSLVTYRGRSIFVVTIRDVSEEVRKEREIELDAQLAARVQNALLSVPAPSEHLEITPIYHPCGYVGGDLYFLDWRYDGSLLRGFLVDATGHGLGTALHTASLHVLLRDVNDRDLPLTDSVAWLNRSVGDYFGEGIYAAALGFELDFATRQMRWVCAGIPKVWMATRTQQGVVNCPGMCLGMNPEEAFDLHVRPIDIGDSFYFMTDGLSELLAGESDLQPERYQEMVWHLRSLAETPSCRDDATAVCIHVQSLPRSLVDQGGWPRSLRFNGFGDYDRLKGEVARILMEVTGKPHSLQEVAVSEALANAMECRDGVPRQHKARLRFNKVGSRLIVRVKTSRIGFAGNALLRRLRSRPEEMFSFGEESPMGRGIPMMLAMSDWMVYNSEGTELLLAWKLEKKQDDNISPSQC